MAQAYAFERIELSFRRPLGFSLRQTRPTHKPANRGSERMLSHFGSTFMTTTNPDRASIALLTAQRRKTAPLFCRKSAAFVSRDHCRYCDTQRRPRRPFAFRLRSGPMAGKFLI